MSQEKEAGKQGSVERGSRFLRNIHLMGAAALYGAAILAPPAAAILAPLAGVGAIEAGGFELARRHASKKRKKSH